MMEEPNIIIRGARQHNLKDIDLDLPRNRLVVITGLSGSGKSSLAFDTLYAEGQRRYVESLSTYARQFLERLEKPDVDLIEGLSPAIAIEQKSAGHNPRSTVGTVTEIYDFLRLLFARVGTPYCYRCGREITSQSIDEIVARVMALPAGDRIIILAPLVKAKTGSHTALLGRLRKQGFARVRVDGEILELEAVRRLAKERRHDIQVVVDRLVLKPSVRNRLADSLELALSQSEGQAAVEVLPSAHGRGRTILFSEQALCTQCGVGYPEMTPAGFSFNSPQGACRRCDGLGTVTEFDPDLIIPNPELSLREGAVAPWAQRNSVHFIEFLESLTAHYQTDIFRPYRDLPESFRQVLLHGSGDEAVTFRFERESGYGSHCRPFEGLIPNLQRRYLETDSSTVREEIRRYMDFHPCPLCLGARLRRESRHVRVGGQTISEVTSLSVAKALEFFQGLEMGPRQAEISRRLRREIVARLGFLQNVGLSYLTLDRAAATLSGGENQRIRLATQVGSKLTGVLYVLDEPSIGLHQRDNRRLLDTLLSMRDSGNTVLVVEHDEETIRSADYVVDMGPGAGMQGGEVVFAGPAAELTRHPQSLTGAYLSGRLRIELPARRRLLGGPRLVVRGARANNLQGIDVDFPLGVLICVTGVSGSGKSSLVLQTLNNALAQRLYNARVPAGAHEAIEGVEYVDKVINIDQAPIGRTPRSNPGTYTGLLGFIRELFSRTPEARMRGFKAGRFSFNVKGGRCESCRGDGVLKIEMHFLPDVYVTCDVCGGRRYNRETLEVRYRGRTIAEVLAMTVNQALNFFGRIRAVRGKLETLVDVGLGYIQIGQPAPTLSGGEAQRIKLARELSRRGTGRTVYILDEPTTGLHLDDIRRLLDVLGRLVKSGNTVIVIEHNLEVIKTADYIVDLGPEGGDEGGRLVACGPPEQVAAMPASHTGRYLQRVLNRKFA